MPFPIPPHLKNGNGNVCNTPTAASLTKKKKEASYSFPWHVDPNTQRYTRLTNEEMLAIQEAMPVPALKKPVREICDTTEVPYCSTFQDKEEATFHSISAMTTYADKSFEELRMGDYDKHPGEFKPFSVAPARHQLPQTDEEGAAPMEWTPTEPSETAAAVAKARQFVNAMATDLSQDSWSDCNFVTPFWDILGDQLTRLFKLREHWKREGKRSELCVGYHYSTPSTIDSIRKHGLLTKADRTAKGVAENFFASRLGDGVYTGNDPESFHEFRAGANCGIMILRLIGQAAHHNDAYGCDTNWGHSYSSNNGKICDIVNLRKSDQCAVLVEFNGNVLVNSRMQRRSVARLQTYFEKLIDKIFGNDLPPKDSVSPIKKSSQVLARVLDCQTEFYHLNDDREFTICYAAPQYQKLGPKIDKAFEQVSSAELASTSDCSVCLAPLTGDNIFRVKGCPHAFHKKCSEMVFAKYSTCPLCRHFFKSPSGPMPSANMTISFDRKLYCPGNALGTIKLGFFIPWGIQKVYQTERGRCFDGATDVAYIPDTVEGRKLLRRMMYAFLHGLMYDVAQDRPGRYTISQTTIPLKTSLRNGDRDGYPDSSYIDKCHQEMDAIGVPTWNSTAMNMPEMEEINRYLKWREAYAP